MTDALVPAIAATANAWLHEVALKDTSPKMRLSHSGLVTRAARFIGLTLANRLFARGDEVVGIDNPNEYDDVRLKLARVDRLLSRVGFQFDESATSSSNARR